MSAPKFYPNIVLGLKVFKLTSEKYVSVETLKKVFIAISMLKYFFSRLGSL